MATDIDTSNVLGQLQDALWWQKNSMTADIPLLDPNTDFDPNDGFRRCAVDRADRTNRYAEKVEPLLAGFTVEDKFILEIESKGEWKAWFSYELLWTAEAERDHAEILDPDREKPWENTPAERRRIVKQTTVKHVSTEVL